MPSSQRLPPCFKKPFKHSNHLPYNFFTQHGARLWYAPEKRDPFVYAVRLSSLPYEKFRGSPEKVSPMLRDLVGAGMDINRPDHHAYPLLRAAEHVDSAEVTRAFLDAGAAPCATGYEAHDAFVLAALHGNLGTLHALLEHALDHPRT